MLLLEHIPSVRPCDVCVLMMKAMRERFCLGWLDRSCHRGVLVPLTPRRGNASQSLNYQTICPPHLSCSSTCMVKYLVWRFFCVSWRRNIWSI